MLFVIHGIDKPDSPIRQALIDEHRAFLAACPYQILASGPLVDGAENKMIGSLVVIECTDRGAAEKLMADEPFNRAGLYESLHINAWQRRIGSVVQS